MHNLGNLPRLFKSNVSSCQMKERASKLITYVNHSKKKVGKPQLEESTIKDIF